MKSTEAVELLESDFNTNIGKFSWKKLVKLIEKANDIYYNSGKMFMTDYLYDRLKDRLEDIFPEHFLHINVGAPIKKD